MSLPCASAISLSAPPPAADIASDADALINAGRYAAAEGLLTEAIRRTGRASVSGAAASQLLMYALADDGRFGQACDEATALLAALPAKPGPNLPQRSALADLQNLYQRQADRDARLQAGASAAHDPAEALALRGRLAETQLRFSEAAALYQAAFRRLRNEPAATQPVRLEVERSFFSCVNRIPGLKPAEQAQMIEDWGFPVLEDPSALPARRSLAMTLLTSVVLPISSESTPTAQAVQTRLGQDLERLAGGGIALDAASFRNTFVGAQTLALLSQAAGAERTGNWTAAAALYRQAAAEELPPALTTPDWHREIAQASQSAGLMSGLQAAPPADHSASSSNGAAFRGVDSTISGDWPGVLGSEGWVLFAVHGDDLCGGPRLIDGSFSYRLRSGDEADPARRWRESADAERRLPADMPLADPAAPGERVISFADDHGEFYPRGAGPDLYIDLSVPAGLHLLSLPVHFSDPSDKNSAYRLYLFAEASGAPAPGRCLSTLLVTVADAPGYARAAVTGPARYTLVLRRLGSYNANLPALLLDPAPSAPTPFTDAFSPDELASAGVGGTGADAAVRQNMAGDTSLLRDVASQYIRGGVAPDQWADLAGRASHLRDAGSLDAGQQAVASWIAWQAQERVPLQTGTVIDAFRRYLDKRFPPSASQMDMTLPDAQAAALQVLSARMRGTGRLALAEAADDAAWDRRASLTQIPGGVPAPPTNTPDPADLAARAWDEGPRAYLAPQTIWLWQGEGGPAPQSLLVALDAEYAARKAAILTSTLLAGGTEFLITEAAGTTGSAGADDHAVAPPASDGPAADQARQWLDQLAPQLGLSLRGDIPSPWEGKATAGTLLQPFGEIVYAAACSPFLGRTDGQDEGKGTAAALHLLLPDQIELLARCEWERDLFATGQQDKDRAEARQLIEGLKVQTPSYPRLALVESLTSAPPAH